MVNECTKRTFVDEVVRLSGLGDNDGTEDVGALGGVERVADVLLQVLGDEVVPHGGRDRRADGSTDGRPQREDGHSDGHVLVRNGRLGGDLRANDGEGASHAADELVHDENGRAGVGERVVLETLTAVNCVSSWTRQESPKAYMMRMDRPESWRYL